MKRMIALLLSCSLLLSSCAFSNTDVEDTSKIKEMPSEQTFDPVENEVEEQTGIPDTVVAYTELGDPKLLRYVEDSIYSNLVYEINDASYFVENISTVYISKEYLEETAYNSKENIYFGYTLSELEELFEGSKFIFTLGENGQTVVKEVGRYDNTFNEVMKNVAIGSGIILVNVTVSAVSGGLGSPAISMIFAASAKTGTIFALSSGVISGCAAGIAKGIETKDFEQVIESAALEGSDGFKWGAIIGSISGSATKTIALKGATLNGLKLNEAALIQKESGYPLDVIKQFKTMEQYHISREAGLRSTIINGKAALVRPIDLNYLGESNLTNLERMQNGLPALDPVTGESYHLHHIGQKNDSTLAILTLSEHMKGGNNEIWHELGKVTSEIDREMFAKQKRMFWMSLAEHAIAR